ncbi:beta-propeller domain-containing protein [Candidatus Uhrbacteria bacterium]|nr:beta-propeller domain-containing protein [Candidatus Uhrbacteria bacterium]
MPTQPKITQPAYLIAGVLFTAIAFVAIVALFILGSKADVTTQEAHPGNAAPTVDLMYVAETSQGTDVGPAGIGAGFTTNEGLPKNIFVGGTITDLNGCHNLMQAAVTLYRSDLVDGQDCAADTNNCYHTTLYFPDDFDGCDTPDDTDVTFETSFSLPNYVDPTDAGSPYVDATWVALVNAEDSYEAQTSLSETYEINSMVAFNVPNAISYGTVALGADSSAIQLTFSNTGNRNVDSDVIALHDPLAQPTPIEGDMVSNLSGFDNIAASSVHYSLSALTAYESATAVSKIASTDLALALPQQTDDLTIPTTDTYWKLRMPASGVQGTYTNVVVFTAKAETVFSVATSTLNIGEPTAMVTQGGYIYVAASDPDIMNIYDNTDYSPTLVGTLTLPAGTDVHRAIAVSGDYAYLAGYATNLFYVVNISNKSNPQIVGSTGSGMDAPKSLAVSGNYVYVANAGGTFSVMNVTTPASPTKLTHITILGSLFDIAISGTKAYVANNSGQSLAIVDISNPATPSVQKTVSIPGFDAYGLTVSGNYAYVTSWNLGSMKVVDVSVPASASVVGTVSTGGGSNSVSISDNLAYVSSWNSNGVTVVDVSTPTAPVSVKTIPTGLNPIFVTTDMNAIYVANLVADNFMVMPKD